MDPIAKKWKSWLLLAAVACGIIGETLIFLHHQCEQVRSILLEDFRIVAFLDSDLTENKAKVVEEKIRALPGVVAVRFVSRDTALEELKSQDAELVQSIALLGENPLPSAYEIRLDAETIANLPAWVDAASKLPDIADMQFKAHEADAISQMEFYSRFIDLTISLAALAWLLAAAIGLWFFSRRKESRHLWREASVRISIASLGTLLGTLLVYGAAYPLRSSARFWVWPSWPEQLLLIAVGALGLCFWPEDKMIPKRSEKREAPSSVDLLGFEDLAIESEE